MSKQWPKVRLGDLCHMVKGSSPTLKTAPGPYPLVVTAEHQRTSNAWQLEGPAVCIPLISSTGHGDAALHRVHYQEGKFALANLLVALLPKDRLVCDAKYLYHLFMARKGELLVPLMLGTANVSLKENDIAGVEITLPPLEEQQRIVARIEELTAQIEEAKALRKQAKEEAEALLMSQSRTIICERGCSENWNEVRLEDACEAIIDYRGRTPPISEDGIPHITSADVRNGKINWQTSKFVTEETYAAFMTRGIPRPQDVLFTMEAPLGEVGVVSDNRKFSVAQRVILLRPKQGILYGEFLAKALSSPNVREDIFSKATATTVSGIASKRLKDVRIPLPPLLEQRRIVAELDAFQAEVNALKRLQSETAAELDALLPSVLDKAFKGEL